MKATVTLIRMAQALAHLFRCACRGSDSSSRNFGFIPKSYVNRLSFPRDLGLALSLLLASLAGVSQASAATTYYVDDNSPDTSHSGQNWSDCFKYLQDALDEADPGDTIKVAGGSYRPDQDYNSLDHIPGSESETFSIQSGVKLFGGYAGLALSSTPDVRNLTLYQSILTGEIGNTVIVTDNSDSVVTVRGNADDTEIDGVVITSGHVSLNYGSETGVGIAIEVPGARPTIRNCQIVSNITDGRGAGIFITGDGTGSPDVTIENCVFEANRSLYGGSMGCRDANPSVKDCFFGRSFAEFEGGAIWIKSNSPTAVGAGTFENCIISGNATYVFNGGKGGGVFCEGKIPEEELTYPTFKKCQFLGNSSKIGGGLYVAHALLNVIDSDFDSNVAVSPFYQGALGGGMFVDHGNLILNTRFRNNVAKTYFHEQDFIDGYGGGLFAAKRMPLLVNCLFHDNLAGTGAGMYGNGEVGGYLFINFLGINCTFSENTASNEGGGYAGHFGSGSNGAAFINSIFWNNHSSNSNVSIQDAQVFSTDIGTNPILTYSCIQDNDGPGSPPFDSTNIDADPLFRNPIVKNYRLKQCSPAIDIGSTPDVPEDFLNINSPDPNTTCGGCISSAPGERTPDLDLRARVRDEPSVTDGSEDDGFCYISCGLVVDMGAYEFIGLPCEMMGDVSANGIVNDKDYSLLTECIASGRFSPACACGDMDGNGVLDSADLVCLFNLITYGMSECGGVVMCDTFGFSGGLTSGGAGEGQETAAEPTTWATLAATGVAESAAACLSQGSQDSEAEVDHCALALRWLAFEQWVAAHSVENFDGSVEAYDAWAHLQFRRIVIEGKMP